MAKQNKQNRLTTFIGGVIDKLSYGDIALAISILLIFCTLYFWISNPFGEGTNHKDLNIFNALYFCIITFSTLGYGDISPVGFGGVVASFEVLSGLALTAIFIGKIASERQSAMLRLIYTSEQQRRLVEFEGEIYKLELQVNTALNEHNHEKLYSLSREIYRFVASIHNYLHFQAHEGNLAVAGNSSSLRRLYKSISEIQLISYEVIRTYGTQQRTNSKFEQINTRITSIATKMLNFHTNDEKINSTFNKIQQTNIYFVNWNQRLIQGNAKFVYRNVVTEYLKCRIKEKLPNTLWPKNIHKSIAHDLEIQNSLCQKCIDILIQEGHWK